HHCLSCSEVQTTISILLHGRGCIWWLWLPPTFFFGHLGNIEIFLFINLRKNCLNIIIILQGNLLTFFTVKTSLEFFFALLEISINCPVFLWFEVFNFVFTLNNQIKGN